MNIIVTGGCGFIGSAICLYLKNKYKNINILSIDNLAKKYSKYNQKILRNNKIFNKIIDLGNFNSLGNIKFKADYIIDCSAEPAVEISKKKISKVIKSNLISTFNVLELAKKNKSKLIFLSSSRIYPIKTSYEKYKKKTKTLFNENTNIIGQKTIYGFTKLSSEMLIEEYNYSNQMEYIINRCGLIYGDGQYGKVEQGLVSLWLWKHINKQNLAYFGYSGNGEQIRDALYISDLCDLIYLQIKNFKKRKNKTYCVGGGIKNKFSLSELTSMCKLITKNKLKIKKIKKTSIYDIPYYVTDLRLVEKNFRWKPKVPIKIGIKKTYKWMMKNKHQIRKFF